MTHPLAPGDGAEPALRERKCECFGCGCSKALCLEYKLHGAIACCPDCRHEAVLVGQR